MACFCADVPLRTYSLSPQIEWLSNTFLNYELRLCHYLTIVVHSLWSTSYIVHVFLNYVQVASLTTAAWSLKPSPNGKCIYWHKWCIFNHVDLLTQYCFYVQSYDSVILWLRDEKLHKYATSKWWDSVNKLWLTNEGYLLVVKRLLKGAKCPVSGWRAMSGTFTEQNVERVGETSRGWNVKGARELWDTARNRIFYCIWLASTNSKAIVNARFADSVLVLCVLSKLFKISYLHND